MIAKQGPLSAALAAAGEWLGIDPGYGTYAEWAEDVIRVVARLAETSIALWDSVHGTRPYRDDDPALASEEAWPGRAAPDRIPGALFEALRTVESRHRQGNQTEGRWVGNSVSGTECNGCDEDWPCSAERLRAACWAVRQVPKAVQKEHQPFAQLDNWTEADWATLRQAPDTAAWMVQRLHDALHRLMEKA